MNCSDVAGEHDAGIDRLRKRIGEAVRAAREGRRLSQGDLAQQIGVRSATVSDIERGKNFPDIATAIRIAQALDVSVDTIVGLETSPAQIEEDSLERGRAVKKALDGQQLALSAQQRAFRQLLEDLLARGVLTQPELDRLLRFLDTER